MKKYALLLGAVLLLMGSNGQAAYLDFDLNSTRPESTTISFAGDDAFLFGDSINVDTVPGPDPICLPEQYDRSGQYPVELFRW